MRLRNHTRSKLREKNGEINMSWKDIMKESSLTEEVQEALEKLHSQIYTAIREIPEDLLGVLLSRKHAKDIPEHIHDMAEQAVERIKEYYKGRN
jgi:NTP pyrophosphatase (non-canonical NTP hydrolase)